VPSLAELVEVPPDSKLIEAGDIDTLWAKYGAYLDYSRNTSYYGHLLAGFRLLYGFDESYFTERTSGHFRRRSPQTTTE
jgi:hypothetical protein